MSKAAKKQAAPRARAPARGKALSHWVDERLPDMTRFASLRDELMRAGISGPALGAWLGPKLGAYRGSEHIKANVMQRSEEVALVRKLSDEIGALAQRLTHGELPLRTHALLLFAAHRDGTNWHDLRDRVCLDLIMMQTLLSHVASNLNSAPAKRGPKQKRARDVLLDNIIEKLATMGGLSKTAARPLALKVLRACGIAAPSPDQKTPEKAASRAAKRSQN